MGVIANHERFDMLAQALTADSVESCLPYPGMTALPPGYSHFARRDAAGRGLCWADACPAYALAAITLGAYKLPEDDEAMETLWDELGGASTQLWPQVRELVRDAWAGLERCAGGPSTWEPSHHAWAVEAAPSALPSDLPT